MNGQTGDTQMTSSLSSVLRLTNFSPQFALALLPEIKMKSSDRLLLEESEGGRVLYLSYSQLAKMAIHLCHLAWWEIFDSQVKKP